MTSRLSPQDSQIDEVVYVVSKAFKDFNISVGATKEIIDEDFGHEETGPLVVKWCVGCVQACSLVRRRVAGAVVLLGDYCALSNVRVFNTPFSNPDLHNDTAMDGVRPVFQHRQKNRALSPISFRPHAIPTYTPVRFCKTYQGYAAVKDGKIVGVTLADTHAKGSRLAALGPVSSLVPGAGKKTLVAACEHAEKLGFSTQVKAYLGGDRKREMATKKTCFSVCYSGRS